MPRPSCPTRARPLPEPLESDPVSYPQAGMTVHYLSARSDRYEPDELAEVEAAPAVDPEDARARTLRGHDLVSRDEAESLAQARSAYHRAIEPDRDFPEPYWTLARTDRGDPASGDEAFRWLEAGRRLLPLDAQMALDLASLRIERGEYPQARRLLDPIARSRESAGRSNAQGLLQALEREEKAEKSVR